MARKKFPTPDPTKEQARRNLEELIAFRKLCEAQLDDELVEIPDVAPPRYAKEGRGDYMDAAEAAELREAIEELSRRENEALKLYEPTGYQAAFHASFAEERLMLGGNRAGKTTPAGVEIARAVTGQDPYEKYVKENGVFIVVGKNLKHNGRVLYPKLFLPGAFKVIYDPLLCRIRAFRPWLEWDQKNADRVKPAPPLIPARFYDEKGVSWEEKKENIPKSFYSHATGWTCYFYSGEAPPPQGLTADSAMFDEEIEHPLWYTEVAARLLDTRIEVKDKRRFVNGRFFWSATPQSGTQHLYDLFERAEAEAAEGQESPSITAHSASLGENPHVSEASKKGFAKKLALSEEEVAIRFEGKFAILGTRVYSEIQPRGVHGVPSFPIPDDWCRYAAVDPGHQVCAVLFVAIPPPGAGHVDHNGTQIPVRGRRVLYDELYIRRANAKIFAARMKERIGDQRIRAWYIDGHGGKLRDIGGGKLPMEQYSEELRNQSCFCEQTREYFQLGSDDSFSGIESVKRAFHLGEDGLSQWCVQWERLPNLCEEFSKYRKRKDPKTGLILDEPIKRHDHLMDDLRMLVAAEPRYAPPKVRPRARNYALSHLEKRRAREKRERGRGFVKLY